MLLTQPINSINDLGQSHQPKRLNFRDKDRFAPTFNWWTTHGLDNRKISSTIA